MSYEIKSNPKSSGEAQPSPHAEKESKNSSEGRTLIYNPSRRHIEALQHLNSQVVQLYLLMLLPQITQANQGQTMKQ